MATLKTNITADASQFLKVIKDVLKSAEQAQKAITDAFNENADIKIDDSGIKSAIDEVSRLEKELSGLSGGVKIDDSEVKKTKQQLDDIDGTTLNVDVETSGLSGLTDAFSGALAGGVLGGGLAGLATAGLEAVVSGFSDAIALGNEFNTALGDLQAKTGATAEEMKELEQASKDAFLGGVGESVAEATQILGNTQIRLGDIFSTKEISDFTAQAQALATTFDLDVNEVVTKATPLIKQYGLSAQEAFETIAFSLQNGANAQDDILDSFAEYSQLAQEAGFSAQELGILISQAGEDGQFNTDKLLDSIKEAQIRIKAGDYRNAFSGMIESANEAEKGVIKSVQSIVDKGQSGELSIAEALKLSAKEIEGAYSSGEISEAIRSQLQVAIAGTPAEDIGTDLYSRAFGADIPQDVIDQQFQEAGESISNAIGQYTSFDAVTRQFELVITEISQGLISFSDTVLAPLIGGVIEIVSGVKDAFDSVFGDFELGGVTDELSGLLDVFNIIVGFLKDRVEATFRAVFGFIRSVIESVQDVFRPLIELVGELANSFGGAGSIFEDFGDIMKDVGDIIGLVGGLIFDLLITPLEFTINILADVITEFLEFIGVLGDTGESGSFVSDILNFIKEALENIKGTIGGVVSAFDALKDALTSLDLGKIVQDLLSGKNPFEGITDQIEDAYDKGFNKATGKFEDALDDQIDANSKAYEQISKDIETLANNRANLSNKELANEKRKLQDKIDSNLKANELIKQDAIKLENQLGQIKVISPSSVDDAKVEIADLSNFITDLLSNEPFKIKTDFELSDIGIDEALDFFNNGTALTGDKDLLAEINVELEKIAELKKTVAETDQFIELQIEGKDKIISDLSSVRNENDKLLNQLEDRRLDLSQQIAFSNTDEQRNKLLKELDTLQDEIIAQTIKTSTKSNLTREELEQLSNERIKKLRLDSLEELNSEILDKEKALNDLKADFTSTSERDLQKLRLELADETNENLKQKEILQAEERFADLLNKFRDNQQAQLLIKQAFDKELRAIDSKYAVTVTSLYEDIAKTFAESLASYDTSNIIDKNKEIEDSISSVKSEYEAETEALNEQLKSREISYSEYNAKIVELEAEKNDKLKELEDQRFGFVDIINDQLTESFKKLAENVKESFAEQSQAVIGYQDKLADYQKQLEDGVITELEYNELTTQAQKDKEEALTASYEAIAVASGATLASLIADGESFTTALAKTALDGLQALIPVFIAEIFGQSLGQLGPIAGPVVAGALTATLQGLVSVAQSSIGGANDGVVGLNESNKGKPKGNDSILMMLAPNESVITSSGTAKNKPYLEFINKGGSIADLINPNVYSSDMSETNKRLIANTKEISEMRKDMRKLRVDHFYDKQPKVFVNNKIELKNSRGVL